MTGRVLHVGSLFSGIGGLDLGVMLALARMGIVAHTVFQVEWSEFCRAVLAAHWPNALRFGDITTLDTTTLPRVDILHGGFPCQTVSLAGKRKAQEDDRWLWPEFARVLRDLRPRIAFLENTPGLLSAGADGRGGALGEVLGDLAALGYRVWWTSVRASDAGAPHQRERWFGLAVLADADGCATERVEPIGISERGDAAGPGARCALVADARCLDGNGRKNGNEGRRSDGEAPGRHEGANHSQLGGVEQLAHGDNVDGEGSDARHEGAGWAGTFGSGALVADARAIGLEGRAELDVAARCGGAATTRCDADRRTADGPWSHGGSCGRGERPWRHAESGVGGGVDGISCGVDGRAVLLAESDEALASLETHRWPAGRGEAQSPGEAPRVVGRGCANRTRRLSALGNGVVPQAAALAFQILAAAALADGVTL